MQKYDGFWDGVLLDYKKLRKLLDKDIREISHLKNYKTGVIGKVRHAFDLQLYTGYDDPLINEMGKVEIMVEELFSSK